MKLAHSILAVLLLLQLENILIDDLSDLSHFLVVERIVVSIPQQAYLFPVDDHPGEPENSFRDSLVFENDESIAEIFTLQFAERQPNVPQSAE